MTRATLGLAPGCTSFGPDDFSWMETVPTIESNGKIYAPTWDLAIADMAMALEGSGDDEVPFVAILLAYGRVGLHHSMTPEAARSVAEGLIRAAEVVEGKIAGQVTAAIAAARAGGGGMA